MNKTRYGIFAIPAAALVSLLLLTFVISGCGRGDEPRVADSGDFSDGLAVVASQRDAWAKDALELVERMLLANPPNSGEPEIRRKALHLLDDPLHLDPAPSMEPVGDFFRRAIDRALLEIETERVVSGATVWKLYNHTFVVRTSDAAYAFDIYRGVDNVRMTDRQLERLARAVDALFITHYHRDHADRGFVELMIEGKKTVAVPEGLWTDLPMASSLTYPPSGVDLEVEGLNYRVFPGHQGDDITNNVYLVSSGGVSVMHTGDQSNSRDFVLWIDGLAGRHRVDILLPNCWTTDLPRLVRETNPSVLITGHENELGHTVDKRESFSKTFRHLQQVSHPAVVMGWGERFHFE